MCRLALMPYPLLIPSALVAARASLNSALRRLVGLKHVICPALGFSFSLSNATNHPRCCSLEVGV